MLCGLAALKVSPYIIHNADYIFLLVLEIRDDILRNQKTIGLDSFSDQRLINLAPFRYTSLCIDYPVASWKKISNSVWLHVLIFIGSLKRLK